MRKEKKQVDRSERLLERNRSGERRARATEKGKVMKKTRTPKGNPRNNGGRKRASG